MSIKSKMKYLFELDWFQFIRLNYLQNNIHRQKGCHFIPYRGTHVQIHPSASILLNAGNVILNANKISGSNAECLVLLRQNARWEVNGPTMLYYGSGIQVHTDAHLINGELNMNTGSLIICAKKITIGNMVSMARQAFIFDSDHHPIYNSEGKRINEAKDVVLEDHVWMGLKSTVLKGTYIGHDCVIGTHALVAGNTIPPHTMIGASPARPVLKDILWER